MPPHPLLRDECSSHRPRVCAGTKDARLRSYAGADVWPSAEANCLAEQTHESGRRGAVASGSAVIFAANLLGRTARRGFALIREPTRRFQVPEKDTMRRARKAKRSGKAPSTQAGEFVREEIHHV